MMTTVTQIPLSISSAFLLVGDRPVLVDAGSPGEERKIARAVQAAGVELEDIALILLTHGHRDHAGSALALREMTGAPVALHPADGDMLERGHMGRMAPIRMRHWVYELYVNRPFPGLAADLPLHEGQSLTEFGVDARVTSTPGHTAGSVSLLLSDGDAVAGDLVIGGYLVGLLNKSRPRLPYFAEDLPLLRESIARLATIAPGKWLLGHGGPVAGVEAAALAQATD